MAETRVVRDLPPCPFCGCRRLRVSHTSSTVYVGCTRCGTAGPYVDVDWRDDPAADKADAAAVAAWGKRKGVKGGAVPVEVYPGVDQTPAIVLLDVVVGRVLDLYCDRMKDGDANTAAYYAEASERLEALVRDVAIDAADRAMGLAGKTAARAS